MATAFGLRRGRTGGTANCGFQASAPWRLAAKPGRLATLNNKTFKVHLDGYNLLPFLKGDEKESPRKELLYWSDDGDLMALRVGHWKVSFTEQHAEVDPKTPAGV